jgi:hypothetical protein
MIIYTNQRSKKKKKTKREIEEYQAWLKSVESQKTNFSARNRDKVKRPVKSFSQKPYVRETPHYPSLNSGHHDTAKKSVPVYTGDKMMGIGTLHKSNAVPIFSAEEALDQATMRR